MKLASLIFSVSQSTWSPAEQLAPLAAKLSSRQSSVDSSDLPLGVAEDDGLGDGQRVVQVTQSVKLPLLPLHGNEELLDPLQGQLITEGAGLPTEAERERERLVSGDSCDQSRGQRSPRATRMFHPPQQSAVGVAD